jgi:hypothetical protein
MNDTAPDFTSSTTQGTIQFHGTTQGTIQSHGWIGDSDAPLPALAPAPSGVERGEKLLDAVGSLQWVPERKVGGHGVVVAAAHPLASDVATVLEVVDDPLNRSRRDPDCVGNVALAKFAVAADGDQHVRVIRQKRP